ncbi:MAG: hypothetical protein Kow0020_14900 [Wenzhouxiangellaceae bacterium]
MTTLWRPIVVVLVLANSALIVLRALQPESPPAQVVSGSAVTTGPEEGADRTVSSPDSKTQCFTLGPLPTLVQQKRAEDRLRPFAVQLRTRMTNADRDRGWWVFVPAHSRSDAIRIARELAARGVEDYFVVADPDLPEAVSLGLFEHLDNARRRMRRIRALGFDAQLTVRRENVPQFWIDYEVARGSRAPWRFILRAAPGAVHFEIPCF